MSFFKNLQNRFMSFIPPKKGALLQESTYSPKFLAEPTDIKDTSKYEQLTEEDKKRVDSYIEELMEGWGNDLSESPISRIIAFEKNSEEKSKELADLILSIMKRIDVTSKSKLFVDATEKAKESVELKLWMEVLGIYDKMLQDIEKETELTLVVLTELKIRLEHSQVSSKLKIFNEKKDRIQDFKNIIDGAKERVEISQQIQLQLRNTVNMQKEACNINAISREISIAIQGLDLQKLEREASYQLLKKIQEKQHILLGTKEPVPSQEITPEYLAQCYAELGKNRKQMTDDLITKIRELDMQIEKIKATQNLLYQARETQMQQGIFKKSPYENTDYLFNLKQDIMPRLKDLEDRYKAIGIFGTLKLKKMLYEVKFKILTLTSKSYFQSYITCLQKDNKKDDDELEVYRQIILSKAKQICEGENSNIKRWFGEEKSKDILNLIKKLIKDKKGDIGVEKILKSSDLLSLVLAFDSDYGIEMIEVPLSQMENVSQIDKGLILKPNISISSIFELYNIEKDFLERQGLTLNDFIDLDNPLMQMYYQYFMYSKKESFNCINDGILYLPEGIKKVTESSNLSKVLLEKCVERIVCPSTLYSIERYAVMSHFLRRIILNEGLIYIGDYAFFESDSLIEFNAPQTLKKIGAGAFCGCKNLQRIFLNEGLNSIGNNAFEDCSSIVEALIPGTVTNFGRNIFDGCNLNKVICSENQKNILQSQCDSSIEIVIGSNNTNSISLE